jgi:hypothetical protein
LWVKSLAVYQFYFRPPEHADPDVVHIEMTDKANQFSFCKRDA